MVHIVEMEPEGVQALSTEELRAEVERLRSLMAAAEAQAKAVNSGPTSKRAAEDSQAAGLELEEEPWCVEARETRRDTVATGRAD